MKILISLLILVATTTGCTYSITMVDTEGTASDVVDETDTPTTSVIPTVAIPATAL